MEKAYAALQQEILNAEERSSTFLKKLTTVEKEKNAANEEIEKLKKKNIELADVIKRDQ